MFENITIMLSTLTAMLFITVLFIAFALHKNQLIKRSEAEILRLQKLLDGNDTVIENCHNKLKEFSQEISKLRSNQKEEILTIPLTKKGLAEFLKLSYGDINRWISLGKRFGFIKQMPVDQGRGINTKYIMRADIFESYLKNLK